MPRFSLDLATTKFSPIPLNNLFIAEFRGSQGDSASAFNTGVNIPTHGQFHHVVATYDNATRTLLFYYDTLATNLGSNVPPNMEWTSMDHPWTSLFVGFRPEWSRRFHGEISIARMYGRPLSAAEVLQNFAERPAVDEKVPLVDHWEKWVEAGGCWGQLLDGGFHPNEFGHRLIAHTLFKACGMWDEASWTCRLSVPVD